MLGTGSSRKCPRSGSGVDDEAEPRASNTLPAVSRSNLSSWACAISNRSKGSWRNKFWELCDSRRVLCGNRQERDALTDKQAFEFRFDLKFAEHRLDGEFVSSIPAPRARSTRTRPWPKMQHQPGRHRSTRPHPYRCSPDPEKGWRPGHLAIGSRLVRPPPDVGVVQRQDLQAPPGMCLLRAAGQLPASSASAVDSQHPSDALTPHVETLWCR